MLPLLWSAPVEAQTAPAQGNLTVVGIDPATNTNSSGSVISGNGMALIGRSYTPTTDRTNTLNRTAFLWTPSAGFTTLTAPNGAFLSGVNADGSVVVGSDGAYFARWTAANNYQREFVTNPGSATAVYGTGYATNADGSVIVGSAILDGITNQAVRWTPTGGFVALGSLGGGASATSMSADTSVVAGSYSADHSNGRQAFRWTAATGMVGLGYLNNDSPRPYSNIFKVTADGGTLIGTSSASVTTRQAVSWTVAQGYTGLGFIAGGGYNPYSSGSGANADGTIVTGSSSEPDGRTVAFRWASGGVHTGMWSFGDLLRGAGVDLTGYTAVATTNVSDDGQFYSGSLRTAAGNYVIYYARYVDGSSAAVQQTPVSPASYPAAPAGRTLFGLTTTAGLTLPEQLSTYSGTLTSRGISDDGTAIIGSPH